MNDLWKGRLIVWGVVATWAATFLWAIGTDKPAKPGICERKPRSEDCRLYIEQNQEEPEYGYRGR